MFRRIDEPLTKVSGRVTSVAALVNPRLECSPIGDHTESRPIERSVGSTAQSRVSLCSWLGLWVVFGCFFVMFIVVFSLSTKWLFLLFEKTSCFARRSSLKSVWYTVWVKKSPLRFSEIFSQTVRNCSSIFYTPIIRSFLH